MKPRIALIFITLVSVISITAQEKKSGEADSQIRGKFANPAYAIVEDDPDLPRVLLIGDSISIGYTVTVREALAGKANLHRIPTNAGHTGMGLEGLSHWLDPKKGRWDLIHFNWGLWDLCYRNPESKTQGNRDKVHGTLTHTPEAYAANLEKIVEELEKTGAVLVFATTTPVPEGEAGRKVGDDLVYNNVARKVMNQRGIRVNDLNMAMAGKMKQYAKAPGDVHFTPKGYEILGGEVAKVIEENLK